MRTRPRRRGVDPTLGQFQRPRAELVSEDSEAQPGQKCGDETVSVQGYCERIGTDGCRRRRYDDRARIRPSFPNGEGRESNRSPIRRRRQ